MFLVKCVSLEKSSWRSWRKIWEGGNIGDGERSRRETLSEESENLRQRRKKTRMKSL
jgi:hypothetical protein